MLAVANRTGILSSTELTKRNDEISSCDFGDLAWSMFIDGEFARGGAYEFGPDYIQRMLKTWDELQHSSGQMDVENLLDVHRVACYKDKEVLRVLDQGPYELLWTCSKDMLNGSAAQLMEDLPEDALEVGRGSDGSIEQLKPRKSIDSSEVMTLLHQIIRTYNENLPIRGPLESLSVFLRSLAWLHPFKDCNGRTRTFLLQRELRRLKLGCGAFMFNNNANIYVSTTQEFKQLILEGIDMAQRSLSLGANPWDELTVEKHRSNFPLKVSESCEAKMRACNKTFSLSQVSGS